MRNPWRIGLLLLLSSLSLLGLASCLAAQTTISTGSIVGTVTDPSGAVVAGAEVSITNSANGRSMTTTTNSAGSYNSGALTPGDYTVTVQAKGFSKAELPVTVAVGSTGNGNVALQVGSSSTVVEVAASSVAVNTVQATVQGVITTQQIEQLPINGRNFLDLAQLEPGVQIQDGANFDPTKNGFSSISFGGRFGRTARIEVDGVDVSDETVGTTTQNIPSSAIQEFQIEQSSLDLSTELTSSGAVNVSTRSGTNQVHGEAFGYGRWDDLAARIAPESLFFRREQFGGNVGGPIKKDKLFAFLDVERTRQDLNDPVQLSAPFNSLSGSFSSPFRENEDLGRLDYQVTPTIHAFYRFTYNIHSDQVPYIPNTYQPFLNRDHTQDHAAGIDFTTGTYTHTIRFGYLRFANEIDVVADPTLINPAPQIELAIGADGFCLTAGADPFCSGHNFLAPQATQQHDLQFKYDGSKAFGTHVLRYGVGVNRILGGGFAGFLREGPAVGSPFTTGPGSTEAFAAAGPYPGGASNPLNYPADNITLGNGQGFSTAIPQFGFGGGGQFDTRFSWYVGDTWKARSNLAVSLGLRYVRDTGRDDAFLPAVSALDQFAPGLGRPTNQPNLNFAPQIGIAWDPWKDGKTAIRAGAGMFYENAVFNNVLFDAPARLQKGLFLAFAGLTCPSVTLPDGTVVNTAGICGAPIGNVAGQIATIQQEYQVAAAKVGAQSNPVYVGSTLTDTGFGTGTNLISPDYRTPYSLQFNIGVERQLRKGSVLSVDYVRNRALHLLLYYDTNHVGDARYLDKNAAASAITTTNAGFGCGPGSAGIDCAIKAGANISSYAANGLDSGDAFAFGFADPGVVAFPGINSSLGANEMLFPIGNSIYNGLDVSLKQNVRSPIPHVKAMNLVTSYSLSRINGQARDQDFINGAFDFDNINHYSGPTALDRTNQFSFGGVMDLPFALRISLVTHADSALPVTLEIPSQGPTAGIFTADITGDGTGAGDGRFGQGDILPGTNVGSFGRSVNGTNINNVISNYNSSYAGKPTPAGAALVNAGLFSTSQLASLGAVAPTIAPAPNGQVSPGGLFTADLKVAWEVRPLKSHESFVIEPSLGIFNITNSANYDGPAQPLSGVLSGTAGSANGTTYGDRTNRTTLGSGVYALGAPRVLEFGMKITF